MTHFILCSGRARHGKDTSAEIIKDNLETRGYRVLVTHYADLLKFICKNFFGWNGEKDEAGRTLLQQVGTNCIREQDPDYWVDFVANLIRMFPDTQDFRMKSTVSPTQASPRLTFALFVPTLKVSLPKNRKITLRKRLWTTRRPTS